MASVATVEFVETSRSVEARPFSLIEQKGLVARLGEELTRAASELSRDPSAFVRGLFFANDRDKRSRRLIYTGLAFGLVVQFVFLAVAAIAGWHRMLAPVKPPEVTMLLRQKALESVDSTPIEKPPGHKDGGGGGQHSDAPASKGPLPQFVPQPQLVNPNPSNIPEPILAVAPTIKGLESPPPQPGQIGDPNGQDSAFAGGPGSEGGIGGTKGTGVGLGAGPGAGPGTKGGKGGGTPGVPDGGRAQIAEVNFNDLPSHPNYTPFSWTRRFNAAITREADENKVIGIVFLRATLHADGTISDVEVVMPVEYGMTESAIQALMRCKFRPATINGRPVTLRKVPIKIHVHYQK